MVLRLVYIVTLLSTLTVNAGALTEAEEWNDTGLKYHRKGEYSVAIWCYDKALELDPDFAWAWNNKGVLLRDAGKYDLAIECFDNAIDIDPSDAMAWYKKGCCYSLLGDKGRALADLKEVVRLDPSIKEDAKTDEDFEAYWDDPDFLEIVGE
jgi:tetratricopeptide (TPR) repeat protein